MLDDVVIVFMIELKMVDLREVEIFIVDERQNYEIPIDRRSRRKLTLNQIFDARTDGIKSVAPLCT
jgi:hypothetical protein